MSSPLQCARCRAELLPESAFCHSCGAPLGAAAGALQAVHGEGERKPITVLFVDAFGSIGLAAPIDAERWLQIVERFFSIVSLAVRRFGGTIDRLTGKGIKVLFGAPAAQENHARQACHAALHLSAVAPLSPPAAADLASGLLGSDPSLGPLARRIAERAGGNPYFVEEIVQALVDDRVLEGRRRAYKLRGEVSNVSVPQTLQAVLAARVDQLADDDKAILQAASVVGREFPVPLLAAVSGVDTARVTSSLARLEEGGFVSSGHDVATYRFRHPLLQESIYRSLLRERRALMHRAVAREAERLQPPGLSGQPAALAFHYEEAGDRLEAASWHARSAHAASMRDPGQAIEHWRRVHELTEDAASREGETLRLAACEAILRLGPYVRLGREEAIALLVEGRRLAARLADARMTALLISTQGLLLGAAGDVPAAITHNREALELASAMPDDDLVLLFGARLVMAHRVAGDLAEASALASRILDRASGASLEPGSAGGTARHQLELARAAISLERGDLTHGAAGLESLLRGLRGDGDTLMLVCVLAASSLVMRLTGEVPVELIARVEESLALARRLALPGMLARALASTAALRLCQARWAEARDLAHAAAERLRGEPGALYVDVNGPMLLAEAHLGLGEAETALRHAREALAVARSRGSVTGEVDCLLVLGRVLVECDERTTDVEARSVLEAGLALALRCELRSREPHFHAALAHLAWRAGEEAKSRALEEEALRLWQSMGATGYAARLAAARAGRPASRSAPASGSGG